MKPIRNIIAVLFLSVLSVKCFAQKRSLEQTLSLSACKYLEKINLDTVVSKQQKDRVIGLIFARSTELNGFLVKKDPRFSNLNTYEQGKKIGMWLSQFVVPIMLNECPKFSLLISK